MEKKEQSKKEDDLRVERYDVAEITAKKKTMNRVVAGVGTAALVSTLGIFGCAEKEEPQIVGGPCSWYESVPVWEDPVIEGESGLD